MFEYPVKIERDTNGTYLVSFPDIPEAHTFGDTIEAAMENANEALEVALSDYVDEWRKLPKASKGRRLARPSIQGELKLSVYKTMRDQGLRKTDLARRMGVALMQIDRVLDLTHLSRIEQLESAIKALNQRVHLELKAA